MKIAEKVDYLFQNHYQEWTNTRYLADQEVSNEHMTFCICGGLCTGLHESSCSRFRNKVNSRTVSKLKHLIPKGVKA